MRKVDVTLTTEDLVILDYLIDTEIGRLHKDFYLIGFGDNRSTVNALHCLNTDIINRLCLLKRRLGGIFVEESEDTE